MSTPPTATTPGRTSIADVAELDDFLSDPTPATIDVLRAYPGDIIVLGVGGKMGPTVARMAKKASELAGSTRRVIGVSRFSSPGLERQLQSWGVETMGADLLDPASYAGLPDAPNVVFMAGMKFGATGQASLTWAMNAHLPALVSDRYRNSRIVAFSTGNVYGLSPVTRGGSREEDALNPAGEYAMSCVGRERMFEHFSRTSGMKVVLLRLNYATELRYGVLVDIAERVYSARPVPLAMGHLNAIWQGDACAMSLQALAHASSPPFVLNIAGPELLSVRSVAGDFGARLQKPVLFEGTESADALLSDARRAYELFGYPRVTAGQMISWIAGWIARRGETLGKPTHFEERTGRF
jgi:nucleoside-diphosphate-sugar epimerase